MKKFPALFTVLTCWTLMAALHAQADPPIPIPIPTHDIGTVQATDQPITSQFFFFNHSNLSFTIDTLFVPCRCVVVEVQEKVIAPTKAARFEVSFDPQGLAGHFERTFFVIGLIDTIQFKLKGFVIPSPAQAKKAFLHRQGDLRFLSTGVAVPPLNELTSSQQAFFVYNQHTDTVQLQITQTPLHIAFNDSSWQIPPNQVHILPFTYLGSQRTSTGYQLSELLLHYGDQPIKLYVNGTVNPSVTQTPLSNAQAQAHIPLKNYALPDVQAGMEALIFLPLHNLGKAPLRITHITTSTPLLQIPFTATELAPTERLYLPLQLQPSTPQTLEITLYVHSNDPIYPVYERILHIVIVE